MVYRLGADFLFFDLVETDGSEEEYDQLSHGEVISEDSGAAETAWLVVLK